MKKITFLILSILLLFSCKVHAQPFGGSFNFGPTTSAYEVFTNPTKFVGILGSSDITVQQALATLSQDAATVGGGDSITVNGSAVDTTANLADGDIDWTLTDGGAGGPDGITAEIDGPELQVDASQVTVINRNLEVFGLNLKDDKLISVGSSSDWTIRFNDIVDDQLLFQTSKTSAGATTDPMYEILVDTGGAGMTADQQIFGIAVGSQASNTPKLTLDEDGDLVISGGITASTYSTVSSATPTVEFYDSDASAGDVNAQIQANATDTGDGTEDVDVIFSQQIAGTMTTFINADADGGTFFPQFKQVKSVFVENPASSDDFLLWKTLSGITVTNINCIVDHADAGESVVIDVRECNSTGDACATVDALITCDNDGAADDGSLSNGAIDANDWINLDVQAVTGTASGLTVTIHYKDT